MRPGTKLIRRVPELLIQFLKFLVSHRKPSFPFKTNYTTYRRHPAACTVMKDLRE